MYLLWHLNQNFREFQKFQKISKSRENVQKGTGFQKEKKNTQKIEILNNSLFNQSQNIVEYKNQR